MDIVYEAIKKIPGITDNEAHEVATKLRSREDLATKADIAELKVEIKAIKWMFGLLFILNVAMFSKLFF